MRISLDVHYDREQLGCHLWQRRGRGKTAHAKPVVLVMEEQDNIFLRPEPTFYADKEQMVELYTSLRDELRAIGAIQAEPTKDKLEQMQLRIDGQSALIGRLLDIVEKGTGQRLSPYEPGKVAVSDPLDNPLYRKGPPNPPREPTIGDDRRGT